MDLCQSWMAGMSMSRAAMHILGLWGVLLTNVRDGKGSMKTRRTKRSKNGMVIDNMMLIGIQLMVHICCATF